jgi:hypothetical protein
VYKGSFLSADKMLPFLRMQIIKRQFGYIKEKKKKM